MSIWTLLQVAFDLSMVVGFLMVSIRLKRPPQDDPRLSRGLQLLQTKITVLEDLSDRTDAQVKQLSSLLDHKTRVVQNKILEAEQQMVKIDHSMNKSLEVAEIFQDKIPHQEILERQRTVEYVKAARMAHSGLSVEEIAKTVPLPREQIELIAKFNREQLMFDETQLPGWATRSQASEEPDPTFALNSMDFVAGLEPRKTDLAPIEKIESEFKRAVHQANEANAAPTPTLMNTRVADTLKATLAGGVEPAVMSMKATAQTLKDKLMSTAEDILRAQAPSMHGSSVMRDGSAATAQVKKVIFPRIEKP